MCANFAVTSSRWVLAGFVGVFVGGMSEGAIAQTQPPSTDTATLASDTIISSKGFGVGSFAPSAEEMAQTPPPPADAPLPSRWYIQGEALFLTRDSSDEVTSIDTNTDERFGTDDLSFGLDTGARLTVGYRLSARSGVEVSGFSFINHEDSDTFTSSILSPGGEVLDATFDPDIADPATSSFALSFQHRLRASSETSNLELNYRQFLSPPADPWQGSLVAGLRYVSLDEDLQLSAIGEDPDIFPNTSQGRYSIDVENDGIGLQVGGDLSRRLSQDLALGLRLRTGLLLNTADQESVLRNDVGGFVVTSDGDGRDTEISPLFELGAFLNWDVSRHVSLNAGYTLLWLGNMGLAAEQFAGSNDLDSSLSGLDRGSVLFHGPSVGVRVRF